MMAKHLIITARLTLPPPVGHSLSPFSPKLATAIVGGVMFRHSLLPPPPPFSSFRDGVGGDLAHISGPYFSRAKVAFKPPPRRLAILSVRPGGSFLYDVCNGGGREGATYAQGRSKEGIVNYVQGPKKWYAKHS